MKLTEIEAITIAAKRCGIHPILKEQYVNVTEYMNKLYRERKEHEEATRKISKVLNELSNWKRENMR